MTRHPGFIPWCARASFPGLADFIGGTITLPETATSAEIDAALDAYFRTFLPGGFVILQPLRGAVFFGECE